MVVASRTTCVHGLSIAGRAGGSPSAGFVVIWCKLFESSMEVTMEKQGMPAVGISLEKDTERTPDTTQFHLFQHDTLIGSFLTRRKAQAAYREAIAASGYQPPIPEDTSQDGLSPVEREQRGRA